MGGSPQDETGVELGDADADGEGVFAISNMAFDYGEEKKYRDFSQQFTRKHRESSHM